MRPNAPRYWGLGGVGTGCAMSRRLLLVDDAEDIRMISCISLERVGRWTVVSVASGEAALRALEHEGPFDAVLLDVMMPGMDGPTTLQQLQAHGLPPAVPVIFLTAKAQSAERQRLMFLGAAGVIAKPFDPLKLPDEITRLTEVNPELP
jgi:two-component system, OmpR family, response regulator